MSAPKLSIIVPIYNVEPYLRKCVESLLTQDLDPAEYEIILVDDGSTDGSGELAEQLVLSTQCSVLSNQSSVVSTQCSEVSTQKSEITNNKSQIIKVLHQPNGGLSAARNTGIMAAKGDYVCFVDSDDYWEPNVLGGLMAQVERDDLDVLRFDYQNVRITQMGDYEVFQPYKHPHQTDMRTDVVDGETYLNERMGYACYAVQFIIRRSLLVGSSLNAKRSSLNVPPILFSEGILYEDTEWTPRMLLAAKRVNSTAKIVYNYLLREGSITNAITREKMQRIVENKLTLIVALKQTSLKTNSKWFAGMIAATIVSIVGILSESLFAERNMYIQRIRDLQVLPLSVKELHNGSVKARLINLSLPMTIRLLHWKNHK